ITFWQFDRSTLDDIEVKSRIVREREVRVSGVPTVVLEVDGRDEKRGLSLGSRLTAAGVALEMTVGPGFKLVLEEESVAKNPSLQVPDLYRLAVVPADKPLGRPDDVKRLRLALEGLPEAAGTSDARQSRSDGGVLDVRRIACADVPSTPLADAERTKYLEATPFIDHGAPSVHARLASVTDGPGRAERLSRLVTGALRYTLATAPMTASAIFEGGAGDCTEYARALVALLRAGGIPAREVSGMAWSGDGEPGFAFHAWAEAYVTTPGESAGRWCALDPTWNQVTLDATHIALSRDDPTAIIGLLGGVKARILEIER
ncbi:MAG: transglutaminase domain-containing protein, partial [Myxococcales bacterium]|nr:transglutaminase domain-containing protein [Myxococcales bacterium]